MAKKFEEKFTVTVTVPKGAKVGDTFEVEVETPFTETAGRSGKVGQLAGIALVDMTDEQLKREIVNANSVLFKATQAGKDEATLAPKKARVEAAKAERAARAAVAAGAVQTTEVTEETSESTDTAEPTTDAIDEETASEM